MTTEDLVRQVDQGKLVAEIPELSSLVNAYQGAGKQSTWCRVSTAAQRAVGQASTERLSRKCSTP